MTNYPRRPFTAYPEKWAMNRARATELQVSPAIHLREGAPSTPGMAIFRAGGIMLAMTEEEALALANDIADACEEARAKHKTRTVPA